MAEYKQEWDGGPTLAPGWYLFRVFSAVEGRSKANDVNIKLRLERLAGANETVFDYLTFSEKAAWMAKVKLIALGYLPKDHHGGFNVEAHELLGKEVWCYVIREDYEGKTQNKVGSPPDMDPLRKIARIGFCSVADFGKDREDAPADKPFDEAMGAGEEKVPF